MKESFNLKASCSTLAPLRKKWRELLSRSGWGEEDIQAMILAVDEAITNVIRHAYENKDDGKISILFEDSAERTQFTIEDWGKRFDPTTLPQLKLPREVPGGLGVHFIRVIMDGFEYDHSFAEGNRIRLYKNKSKG